MRYSPNQPEELLSILSANKRKAIPKPVYLPFAGGECGAYLTYMTTGDPPTGTRAIDIATRAMRSGMAIWQRGRWAIGAIAISN